MNTRTLNASFFDRIHRAISSWVSTGIPSGKALFNHRQNGIVASARFALLSTVIIAGMSPAVASAAGYGAPAGWRNVPDYPVFTDRIDGQTQTSGGLELVDGNMPVDTIQKFEDKPSLRFNVTQANMTSMSFVQVLASWASHDISGYLPNGFIEFNVKGQNGGEDFKIGAVDHFGQRRPIEIRSTVAISKYATVTKEWQHVKIPLADVFNPSTGIDAYCVKGIILDVANKKAFKVWINQIKLTTADKERGYPAIKINQVGYLNSAAKYAKVSGFEDEFQATVGTPFQVRKSSDNSVVYAGQLALVKDYDSESGERVLKAEFSALKDSGVYYITVDAPGIGRSLNFSIGGNVFKPLVADASRYYFYQRSGMDITAQYHDFPRVDPLPLDHVAIFESNPSKTKNVSKGWFDAGDKGKWMASGASAATTQLWSYEMFPESYADNTNLPESGNGVPDVLDEVRWELEWILKMQDTDGGVYGKVDDNSNRTARVIRDMYNGASNVKPTNDTALAATALAHASWVYSKFDPAFAAECLKAAKLAWDFLEKHPDNIKGPGYTADSDTESRLGAAAALFRTTGASNYNAYFLANYTQFKDRFENRYSDWAGATLYAFADYAQAAAPDATVVTWFRDRFTIYKNDRLARYEGNAWGNAISNGNYYWGSNNIVIGTALEIMIGSKVLGVFDVRTKDMVLDSLNYVLGSNAMRKSFVTGYGEDAIKTVFSTFNEYPGQGVPKGWIPLGVNRYNGGGSSNFPAKDYLDSSDEWTTNEHSVGAACNLMFVSAYANSRDFTDQTAPVTISTLNPAAPDGGSGWYKSDVTVSLAATDDLAGVAKTEYSVDGATSWQIYTTPIIISDVGHHTVAYRSTDNSLNIETSKSVGFTIAHAPVEFTLTGGGSLSTAIKTDYDGSAHSVGIDSSPAGIPSTISYNGSTTLPKLPGVYHFVATSADPNYFGSASGSLEITSNDPGRLINLSIRAAAGAGSDTLIVGFVTRGGSGNLPVLVRGIGPTLAVFEVAGTLSDPRLTLYHDSNSVSFNDDWDASLQSVFTDTGAFTLPSGSKDAALAGDLPAGAYTTHLQGADSSTGVALGEIYDRTTTYSSSTPVLMNVSARCRVGAGDEVLIAGFVITGSTPMKVLVRAIGPTLSGFGVAGTLSDPSLTLFHGSTSLATNDDWDSSLAPAFTQAGAFPLTAGSGDAALVAELAPGAYTAHVRSVDGSTGVALVEVYAVTIP